MTTESDQNMNSAQTSLAKWQNGTTTSGLVEMLLREYVSGGLSNQPSQ